MEAHPTVRPVLSSEPEIRILEIRMGGNREVARLNSCLYIFVLLL
jgi:hypothetical protein